MSRLKHNGKWKLISLLLGILLWSYVTAAVNPTQQITLRDVEIELRNTEILSQSDYVITKMQPRLLTVQVSGKRNRLGDLRARDVKAIVDVKDAEEGTSAYSIRYEAPNDVSVSADAPSSINVTIEKVIERSFPVTVRQEGELLDDYILENLTTTPENIMIHGPRSLVENVDRIEASLAVATIRKSGSSNVQVRAYSKEDQQIDGLTFSLPSVNVAYTVSKQKEVPISVALRGESPADVRIIKGQSSPSKILVKGKEEAIDMLEQIMTEPIDRAQWTKSGEQEYALVFPEGVSASQETNSAKVSIVVEKKTTKNIEIPLKEVVLQNAPSGVALGTGNPEKITVTLYGFAEDLEPITAEQLEAYVDASKVSGTGITLPVQVKWKSDVPTVTIQTVQPLRLNMMTP